MQLSQTRAKGPGGAPSLPWFKQDLAAFLLVRSEFAWLGYSWRGCNQQYTRPAMLDADFGVPMDAVCKEVGGAGSGVFTRAWTKATVTLDTNSNTATITMK